MTNSQASFLSVGDAETIKARLQEYGFEHVGPSVRDAFLFKDDNGKAWLLTAMGSQKVAPTRMMLPSAWTETNLEWFKKNAK